MRIQLFQGSLTYLYVDVERVDHLGMLLFAAFLDRDNKFMQTEHVHGQIHNIQCPYLCFIERKIMTAFASIYRHDEGLSLFEVRKVRED